MYREEVTLIHTYNNMTPLNFSLLCIFPVALFFVLFFKCRIFKKNEFDEECWGIDDARSLQVFAALGVLIHHLTGAATKYGEVYKGPVTVMSYAGILFTSIFFFFSGFGLIRSYELKENYLDGFLKKKFMAIFIPFMASNLLYVIVGLAERRINDALSFFTSVFGFTLINTNAWFIVEIIILYIVFYFSYKYIKDDRKKLLAVVGASALITLTGFLLKHDYTAVNGHWFRGEWWFNTTMIFAVGLIFGKNRDAIVSFFKKHYIKLLVTTMILLAAATALEALARENLSYYVETFTYNGYPEKLGTYAAQSLLCFLFIIFVLLVSMKLKYGNRMIKFLSSYTLEIYLVQHLCMMNYGYESKSADWLTYLITIAMSIAVAFLFSIVLKLIRENLIAFFEKRYKDPENSFERKEKYRKMRSITICFIVFYAVMAIGLLISCGMYVRTSYKESITVSDQINQIRNAELYSEVPYGYYDIDYFKDGNEVLTWYVIKKDDDRALLLLKDSLYPMSYLKEHQEVTYEDSDIRDILINEGLYDMFSKSARKHLLTDDATGDKVFLLSEEEIYEYSIPLNILMSKPVRNAKEYTGIYIDERNDNTAWWLRCDEAVIYGTIVNSRGEIAKNSEEVNRPRFAVRPAIWVDLK